MNHKPLPLSLLTLRPDTRRDFVRQGITSLHQIVALQPDDLRQLKGIKTLAETIHAQARAWVENGPVFCAPVDDVIALRLVWKWLLENCVSNR